MPPNKLTSEVVAKYASDVAQTQAMQTESEEVPFEETGPEAETINEVLQRYAPHITIASTLIGLATFTVWFVTRRKN
jgi:hypothetical protein